MMQSILTWNNFGLLLTAIGTGLTFWQSYKARSYKNEIVLDRAKSTIPELIRMANEAKSNCRKIVRPVDINNPPRGVDQQDVIDKIEIFLEHVQENNHRIKKIIDIEAVISNAKTNITNYKTAPTERYKYSYAGELQSNINIITVKLNEARDGI